MSFTRPSDAEINRCRQHLYERGVDYGNLTDSQIVDKAHAEGLQQVTEQPSQKPLVASAVGRQIGEYLTKKKKRGKPSDYGVRVIINGKQVSMHSKDVIESVQRFKGQEIDWYDVLRHIPNIAAVLYPKGQAFHEVTDAHHDVAKQLERVFTDDADGSLCLQAFSISKGFYMPPAGPLQPPTDISALATAVAAAPVSDSQGPIARVLPPPSTLPPVQEGQPTELPASSAQPMAPPSLTVSFSVPPAGPVVQPPLTSIPASGVSSPHSSALQQLRPTPSTLPETMQYAAHSFEEPPCLPLQDEHVVLEVPPLGQPSAVAVAVVPSSMDMVSTGFTEQLMALASGGDHQLSSPINEPLPAEEVVLYTDQGATSSTSPQAATWSFGDAEQVVRQLLAGHAEAFPAATQLVRLGATDIETAIPSLPALLTSTQPGVWKMAALQLLLLADTYHTQGRLLSETLQDVHSRSLQLGNIMDLFKEVVKENVNEQCQQAWQIAQLAAPVAQLHGGSNSDTMMMPSQAHHAVPIGTRLGSNIPVCGGALAVRSSQRGVLGGSNTQVEANAQIGGSRQAACNVEGDLTGHGGPGLDERKVYAQRLTGMAVVGQKRVQIWRFHYGMTGAAGNEDKFLYLPHDAINLWGRVDPTQDQLKKVKAFLDKTVLRPAVIPTGLWNTLLRDHGLRARGLHFSSAGTGKRVLTAVQLGMLVQKYVKEASVTGGPVPNPVTECAEGETSPPLAWITSNDEGVVVALDDYDIPDWQKKVTA